MKFIKKVGGLRYKGIRGCNLDKRVVVSWMGAYCMNIHTIFLHSNPDTLEHAKASSHDADPLQRQQHTPTPRQWAFAA